AAVQVPPGALVGVVVYAQFDAALRARESSPARVAEVHVNAQVRHVHLHALHRPWRRHTQQLPVQLDAVHRVTPARRLRESVSATSATHSKPRWTEDRNRRAELWGA